MNNRITLRHLEAFRAVMVQRTVTGAAAMLGVTQPVVTRLLSDLEERVAITLFRRSKGRLIPTGEATLLLEDVHQALVSIERIANAASNTRVQKLARLDIAAAPSMALSFLPNAIAAFSAEHPETLVALRTHSTPTVLELVHGGHCDLGFVMHNTRKTGTGQSELLLSARMVGVLPLHHRLAGRKLLQPADFEGERFVAHSQLLDTRSMIDAIMLSHGVNRQINIEAQLSATILKLVEAGAGISLLDPISAGAYTGGLLKFIPFEPVVVADYAIVFSSRAASTLAFKPFLDHVKREIRKVVPQHLVVVRG